VAGNFDKTQAQILTKIANGHNATYTAAQVTAIQSWLDAEVAARAGQTAGPSPARQLMATWSGCMSQADWDAAKVAVAFATKQTGEGTCQQCHVNGQGFLASQDSARVFSILTTQTNPTRPGKMFMEYYFAPDLTTDPANPKMVINSAFIANAGTGQAQHPLFTLPATDPAMVALQAFYDKTAAKFAAKTCDAPKFTP